MIINLFLRVLLLRFWCLFGVGVTQKAGWWLMMNESYKQMFSKDLTQRQATFFYNEQKGVQKGEWIWAEKYERTIIVCLNK